MTNERPDYRVLRPIPDRNNPARSAYQEGELIHTQVVEDWGLTVGEDVTAARSDVLPRPADNASTATWAAYAVAQGMDSDEASALSRNQLRDRYPAEEPAVTETETTEQGAEPAEEE